MVIQFTIYPAFSNYRTSKAEGYILFICTVSTIIVLLGKKFDQLPPILFNQHPEKECSGPHFGGEGPILTSPSFCTVIISDLCD